MNNEAIYGTVVVKLIFPRYWTWN